MSETQIDAGLLEAVAGGQAVLFLGAGASRGATKLDGTKIPLADELSRRIADEFLGPGYEDADFKTICDFAASARSVRELQAFLRTQLIGYNPAAFHMLIPAFAWAGIASTNYDLIVEEAYRLAEKPIQQLVPNCSDSDGAAERLGEKGLLYVKLHGCITHYQEVRPPLVASTEQIINHKEGRAGQFAQFLEWAKTKTIVFAGYKLGDFNLRTLFEEIRRDGDNHRRHYLVRPGIKSAEADYWMERRVRTISSSFEDFLNDLDRQVRSEARQLALVPATFNRTTFTRFIARANVSESPGLIRFMESQCEHVSAQTTVGVGTPQKFYRGFDLGWYPIAENLDVPRRVANVLLEERVVPSRVVGKPQCYVLKSHAGGGKTIVLRRVAWEAAQRHDRLVFWLQNATGLDKEIFEEIVSLTNQTIFLFIDDVAEDAHKLADFFRHAERQKWPVILIGGARVNEWNTRCEDLEPLVDEEYELAYLSEREIEVLLDLLSQHECLGHLGQLPREDQHKKLKEVYGRQLLVALHEATENASFREIIADEYKKIPAEARVLYLDICSLHRFGPPVRAGLIARVHGIGFEEFSTRFLAPLEQVIDLKRDSKTQDWVYVARHSVIADIVYNVALPSVREKFDNLIRILSKLNSSYSYDREVSVELIRGSKLAELFRDPQLGQSIYEVATQTFGELPVILHQRGIYEMRLAGDQPSLERAEQHLQKALDLATGSPSIKHSLAELAFKRSGLSKSDAERDSWLRVAESQATNLGKNSRSSYPLHTLAKVAIARVKDALERVDAEDNALTQEALSTAIKDAEDALRSALQKFPNDDRILNEEATLSEILQNAGRALTALQRAFQSNPRSELIARRLSRILRAKGEYPEAIGVLRQTLELNPGSQILHYDMAQTLRESRPDADAAHGEALLYHFHRSFSPGDRNNEARFWYARQLCLQDKWPDAKLLFESLKQLPIPYRNKRGVRGKVLSADGSPVSYYGQLTGRRPLFGFVRGDEGGVEAFVPLSNIVDAVDMPAVGTRLSYLLGFNLAGPVALDVKIS